MHCHIPDVHPVVKSLLSNHCCTCHDALGDCAGRIVLSTIPENDGILKLLLGVTPQKFQPSIPHLVSLLVYTNFYHVKMCIRCAADTSQLLS